jgi:cytochrome d ubiquinol oxidase subunit II
MRYPPLLLGPAVAIAALIGNRSAVRRGADRRAFIASSAYVAGVLASVAAGLYPMLLPAAVGNPGPGLDIYNAAAPAGSLRVALIAYLIGLSIVSGYLVYVYRVWRGKAGQVYR